MYHLAKLILYSIQLLTVLRYTVLRYTLLRYSYYLVRVHTDTKKPLLTKWF